MKVDWLVYNSLCFRHVGEDAAVCFARAVTRSSNRSSADHLFGLALVEVEVVEGGEAVYGELEVGSDRIIRRQCRMSSPVLTVDRDARLLATFRWTSSGLSDSSSSEDDADSCMITSYSSGWHNRRPDNALSHFWHHCA